MFQTTNQYVYIYTVYEKYEFVSWDDEILCSISYT